MLMILKKFLLLATSTYRMLLLVSLGLLIWWGGVGMGCPRTTENESFHVCWLWWGQAGRWMARRAARGALEQTVGWGPTDKHYPSVCSISSLREEVARFLSFYCKSPAPLKPENVSSSPPLLSPTFLPTSPTFG